MSYDVDLVSEPCITCHRSDSPCTEWNYTYNCSGMWAEAGFSLQDFDGIQAGACAVALRRGIEELVNDPAKYRPMEPSNGWGSYSSSIERLLVLAEQFEEYPKCRVRVT